MTTWNVMKKQILTRLAHILSASLWLLAARPAFAQTASFTYEGRLTQAGNPVTGIFDLQCKLFDTANVGAGAYIELTLGNVLNQSKQFYRMEGLP
jgi:hypothetical protein